MLQTQSQLQKESKISVQLKVENFVWYSLVCSVKQLLTYIKPFSVQEYSLVFYFFGQINFMAQACTKRFLIAENLAP